MYSIKETKRNAARLLDDRKQAEKASLLKAKQTRDRAIEAFRQPPAQVEDSALIQLVGKSPKPSFWHRLRSLFSPKAVPFTVRNLK